MRLLCVLPICLLAGCTQLSDVPLRPGADLLVVNAHMAPGRPWLISVSGSLSPDELQSPINKSDAEIAVYENGTLVGKPVYTEPPVYPGLPAGRGYYGLTHPVAPGAVYEVRVSADGYETVLAYDTVPVQVPVLRDLQILGGDPERQVLRIATTLAGPDTVRGYFHLIFWIRNRADTSSKFILPLYADPNNTNIQQDDSNGLILTADDANGLLLDNRNFVDGSRLFLLDLWAATALSQPGQFEMQAELRAVSWSYYTYYESLLRQLSIRDNPFAEPVSIYNNVSGGLGNVSAYQAVTSPWQTIP